MFVKLGAQAVCFVVKQCFWIANFADGILVSDSASYSLSNLLFSISILFFHFIYFFFLSSAIKFSISRLRQNKEANWV